MICLIENEQQFRELMKPIIAETLPNIIKSILSEIQPENKIGNELIDNQGAEKMFNVTGQTLYNWRRKGFIKFRKQGGKIYYSLDELVGKTKQNNKRGLVR